jgi:DNA-binding NtrC family response regulator
MSKAKLRLLIVDDEKPLADSLQRALRTDFDVTTAESKAAGLHALEIEPDIVLLDIRLRGAESDDRDGIDLLEETLKIRPGTPIVMMSALGDIETAVECMRLGAADFIKKPADVKELRERLRRTLASAAETRRAVVFEQRLKRFEVDDVAGDSSVIGELHGLAARVAGDERSSTVLITGETGTGKEVVARMIHRLSPRADKPFVVVQMTSVPESLAESQLFGHEKGAFTGADARKPGLLELAGGGTLLLDEVGDMPAALQAKLLRFLQDRTYTRVGGTTNLSVDARILAATNRDLQAAVKKDSFRQDLYFRLAVLEIRVPPLRARKDDLPFLCSDILLRRAYRSVLTPPVLEVLAAYDWPGNIRELENVLDRALLLAGRGPIELCHIQLPRVDGGLRVGRSLGACSGFADVDDLALQEKVNLAKAALERTNWNVRDAAERLGITRQHLDRMMKDHQLSKPPRSVD